MNSGCLYRQPPNSGRCKLRMTISVASTEYLELQNKINSLQASWMEKTSSVKYEPAIHEISYRNDIPLIAQTNIKIDVDQYILFIKELVELLNEQHSKFNDQMNRVLNLLNTELATIWINQTLSLNHLYFNQFAKEFNLEEWIPFFLAEQGLRPYLQNLSNQYRENYSNQSVEFFGCPSCGEPVRLGRIKDEGQKVLHCPRCHADWQEKRLKCSHCGNEDHDTLSYLTIEGDSTEQIHVCKVCNGYVKLIDDREALEKLDPTMLDLTTIHLDYIAQQKGYGLSKD